MDQEKFGKFIKEIRKKHNITQKQLADKYNVTYQAVSKWENGKNMPDMVLLKQMSKDFGISLEEMVEGELKKVPKKKNIWTILLICIIVIIVIVLLVLGLRTKENDFEFKTLSSTCNSFNISGNIAYSKNKSAIYITNIKYCGGEDNDTYKEIECVLYETSERSEKRISSYMYEGDEKIKLEDFLEMVTLSVDDYEKTCKEYTKDSLYLAIKATGDNDKIVTYKIPLSLNDSCTK